jgi:hypothetical protein
VIKSRRVRWAGHAVSMGEMKNAYKILVGKPQGKDNDELIACVLHRILLG